MNGQLFLSPLSFILRHFNDSMCLFAFLYQGFSVHWLDLLFQIDMVS